MEIDPSGLYELSFDSSELSSDSSELSSNSSALSSDSSPGSYPTEHWGDQADQLGCVGLPRHRVRVY